jgi:hypothetical protein
MKTIQYVDVASHQTSCKFDVWHHSLYPSGAALKRRDNRLLWYLGVNFMITSEYHHPFKTLHLCNSPVQFGLLALAVFSSSCCCLVETICLLLDAKCLCHLSGVWFINQLATGPVLVQQKKRTRRFPLECPSTSFLHDMANRGHLSPGLCVGVVLLVDGLPTKADRAQSAGVCD